MIKIQSFYYIKKFMLNILNFILSIYYHLILIYISFYYSLKLKINPIHFHHLIHFLLKLIL